MVITDWLTATGVMGLQDIGRSRRLVRSRIPDCLSVFRAGLDAQLRNLPPVVVRTKRFRRTQRRRQLGPCFRRMSPIGARFIGCTPSRRPRPSSLGCRNLCLRFVAVLSSHFAILLNKKAHFAGSSPGDLGLLDLVIRAPLGRLPM